VNKKVYSPIAGIASLPRKRRLVATITLLLVLGFVATSMVSYMVSGDTLRDQIRSSDLPLTSDNIYSDIQNDLLPPILVSATMAQDTFLRDWALNGEKDTSKIIKYLSEVRSHNDAISAFFVSDKTRNYYHPTGIIKQVSTKDARDGWYFRVRKMASEYEINVHADQANANTLTVFINHKVYDYHEHFIGVTGVGLKATQMLNKIDHYETRYHREIYFVDSQGFVVLEADTNNKSPRNIADVPGLDRIADQALSTITGTWTYMRGGESMLLNTRYIPKLDWYLFVEQPEGAVTRTVRHTFYFSLAIGLSIAALVVVLTYLTIQGYQRHLERMATTDNLTGVTNRHGFEMLADPWLRHRSHEGIPDSVIMLDLDQLKQINDRHGHLTGDQVIREVARLARDALRSNDLICRWGGEEFVVWLRGCCLDDAMAIAEKIRKAIRARRFSDQDVAVTASIGVVEHRLGDSLEQTLGRADRAMYDAKDQGRDRTRTVES